MTTHSTRSAIEFEPLGRRQVVADFSGGRITSDGGLLLVHELLKRTGLLDRFADCFEDFRNPRLVEHSVGELLKQRVLALMCGYEDINDHDTLRDDLLLTAVVGKKSVGTDRRALASPSTLNRLELTPANASKESRYCKIAYDSKAIERFFVQTFLDAHKSPRKKIIIDLDATDDPLHGKQEGRFFHGYYGHYCYLPLYIFCDDYLLWAQLRPSGIDGSAGALEAIEQVVGQIRERWPDVEITLRADSGFAREKLMAWCETSGVNFVFGLARNKRLEKMIETTMAGVRLASEESGEPVREFEELSYRTLNTWSRERRVVSKVEHLPDKSNPRFVVTSLAPEQVKARRLYEKVYCARGEMENRIKEQQLGLFADRTSAHTMRANQLRLWLASVAYVVLMLIRRFGLRGTELERAQVGTIRLRLLKIGGVVRISVRRIVVALSEASPMRNLLARILAQLRRRLPAFA